MRILLVEDGVTQLEPLHAALLQAGHIVDGVEDGETAQWLLSQKDYDLLILDWMLPTVKRASKVRGQKSASFNPTNQVRSQKSEVRSIRGIY